MVNYFFKRDNKEKIRSVKLCLNEHNCNENGESFVFYSITGETGLYEGTKVKRPLVTIEKGKANRSIKEQAELQYNSLCSSYKDKGYKSQEYLGIKNVSDALEVNSKVPTQNTDANGNIKPQLALQYEKVKQDYFKRKWKGSRKLDGVRCTMKQIQNEIKTSSRGGKEYDIPATYIRQDTSLQNFFNLYPNILLDGELYIHGKPLSYISGLVRLQNLSEKHKELNYYVYDIVDESLTFEERLNILQTLKNILFSDSKVKVVEHVDVDNWDDILKLHNQFVSEGYEGLVLRDPTKKYKCNARDKRMIKVKQFEDHEYEIVGITEGLREEDFVFNMKTKEGYPFEAKPMGDRELKKWYRENITNLVGQMATVKHFGMTNTNTPVPNLPVFKSIRNYE